MEGADEVLVYVEHRAPVLEESAVVGRGEDGDQLSLAEELVALLDDLIERRVTWWERQMRSRSLALRNCESTSSPKM